MLVTGKIKERSSQATYFVTCFRDLRIDSDLTGSGLSVVVSSGEVLTVGFVGGPEVGISLLMASMSAPYLLRWSSYFLKRASNSASGNRLFRRLGGMVVGETHSTRALTQFAQGSLRSHLTLRCWQSTHGCFFLFWDPPSTPGVDKGGETFGWVSLEDIPTFENLTIYGIELSCGKACLIVASETGFAIPDSLRCLLGRTLQNELGTLAEN